MTYGNYVGCMTGTSVDGLDLALIEVSPLNRAAGEKETIVVLNALTRPFLRRYETHYSPAASRTSQM